MHTRKKIHRFCQHRGAQVGFETPTLSSAAFRAATLDDRTARCTCRWKCHPLHLPFRNVPLSSPAEGYWTGRLWCFQQGLVPHVASLVAHSEQVLHEGILRWWNLLDLPSFLREDDLSGAVNIVLRTAPVV